MDSQAACYAALLNNQKLDNGDFWCYLNDADILVDDEGSRLKGISFDDYQNWQIYKEPKWYENIPDGGVLCWVSDSPVRYFPNPLIVEFYRKSDAVYKFYVKKDTKYKYAKPLTKHEIQKVMDNAPK